MVHTYQSLLEHDLWITRRSQILARDGHQCVNCRATTDLVVHHRQYHIDRVTGKLLMPWDYADRYLITLCKKCHEIGHKTIKVPSYTK